MLKVGEGGLGLVNVGVKVRALQARNVVRLLARDEDDKYRRFYSFWMGLKLRKILPDLARAPNVEVRAPDYFEDLKDVVLELVPDVVSPRAIGSLKTKMIYNAWMVH